MKDMIYHYTDDDVKSLLSSESLLKEIKRMLKMDNYNVLS